MKAWTLKSDGSIIMVVADYREVAVGLICEQIRGSSYADIDRLIGYVGEFENNNVIYNDIIPNNSAKWRANYCPICGGSIRDIKLTSL